MGNTQTIVEMRGVTKTFGSTRALRGVDFTVERGEVHALLGRNGRMIQAVAAIGRGQMSEEARAFSIPSIYGGDA